MTFDVQVGLDHALFAEHIGQRVTIGRHVVEILSRELDIRLSLSRIGLELLEPPATEAEIQIACLEVARSLGARAMRRGSVIGQIVTYDLTDPEMTIRFD